MKHWTSDDLANLAMKRQNKKKNLAMQLANNLMNCPGKPRRKQKLEESLQIQVATYLKLNHPNIIFRSDFAAGIKMTMGQAVRHKAMQSGRAYPDLFIAEPRGIHCGLFLELKRSKEEILKKDGKLREDVHVQEQNNVRLELLKRGYQALFACGFDEAIEIIENYLKIE